MTDTHIKSCNAILGFIHRKTQIISGVHRNDTATRSHESSMCSCTMFHAPQPLASKHFLLLSRGMRLTDLCVFSVSASINPESVLPHQTIFLFSPFSTIPNGFICEISKCFNIEFQHDFYKWNHFKYTSFTYLVKDPCKLSLIK